MNFFHNWKKRAATFADYCLMNSGGAQRVYGPFPAIGHIVAMYAETYVPHGIRRRFKSVGYDKERGAMVWIEVEP